MRWKKFKTLMMKPIQLRKLNRRTYSQYEGTLVEGTWTVFRHKMCRNEKEKKKEKKNHPAKLSDNEVISTESHCKFFSTRRPS